MSFPDESDGVLQSDAADEYRYERAPNERPSVAVVTAVATAAGRPVTPGRDGGDDGSPPLSPLYDHLDPDALDTFVTAGDDRGSDRSVTFHYDGYRVCVGDGAVTVTPAD